MPLTLLWAACCFLAQGQPAAPDTSLEELRGDIDALRKEIAALRDRDSETYRGAPPGGFGAALNPDLSVIANLNATLTDDAHTSARNRVALAEVELAIQGYLYPGIRADVIAAFENTYDREDGEFHMDAEVHLEEAYLTITTLPWQLDRWMAVKAGRMLLEFGRLNAIHPHHRPFIDTPLPLLHFLGSHNWNDDGVQVDVLLPNPFKHYDLYVRWSSGIWNGKKLHAHGHEHDNGHGHGHGVLPFHGLLFQQRLYAGFPLGDDMDLSMGASAFWDEYDHVRLYGVDLGYHWQWPGSYRRTKIGVELFAADARVNDVRSYGGFAYLDQSFTKHISAGLRYDWSEYADDDHHHAWRITPFATYHFTESFYARAAYRYDDMPHGRHAHAALLQIVWGLGPHSHRLTD